MVSDKTISTELPRHTLTRSTTNYLTAPPS